MDKLLYYAVILIILPCTIIYTLGLIAEANKSSFWKTSKLNNGLVIGLGLVGVLIFGIYGAITAFVEFNNDKPFARQLTWVQYFSLVYVLLITSLIVKLIFKYFYHTVFKNPITRLDKRKSIILLLFVLPILVSFITIYYISEAQQWMFILGSMAIYTLPVAGKWTQKEIKLKNFSFFQVTSLFILSWIIGSIAFSFFCFVVSIFSYQIIHAEVTGKILWLFFGLIVLIAWIVKKS